MPDLPDATRRDLAAAVARVQAIKADIAASLDELGVLLLDVRARELWAAGGHANFQDCVTDAFGLSRTTAYRAMDLATHFGPEIARRYGSEKLLAMHRYQAATARDEQPGDLLAADIVVQGPGGVFRSVPMNEASVRQIHEATRLLAARNARRETPADRAERLARLADAMPKGPSRVAAREAPDGSVLYDFKGVREADRLAFIAVLQAEFPVRA